MNDLLYKILTTAITVCVVAFMRYALPWIRTKAAAVEADLTAKHYDFAAALVKTLVYAAEQTISGSGNGEYKLSCVESLAKKAFADAHITISSEQLDALIEATVKAMNDEKAKETAA